MRRSTAQLPWYVYAGLVFGVAAGVAAVLQLLTDLAVPRFTSILLIQPIPALLLFHYLHDAAAWAAVLTATAAIDLLIADRSHKRHTHGKYLKFAIRRLQEVVNLAGLVYGTIALVHAHDTFSSFRAGATVVGAAVVGLGSGLLFKQQPLPHIATGIATLASIGGFAKMAAYAFPGSGLLAAAAAITAHAFTVRLVPKYAQRGAQIAAAAAAVADRRRDRPTWMERVVLAGPGRDAGLVGRPRPRTTPWSPHTAAGRPPSSYPRRCCSPPRRG